MSAHVHAFLELANSGYTWNVKVNDAGDLSCQAATPPPLVRENSPVDYFIRNAGVFLIVLF
tara:strand:+ start:3275 stop:3457 length:183 start_codon:yes stop_codon:yes gene_type:complete